MGNKIVKILKRLFDFPIKPKPICFYNQENFTSTGEPVSKEEVKKDGPVSDYDKLIQAFYSRLLEQRSKNMEEDEKADKLDTSKVTNKYPGWDELTISNLHSLFLLFDQQLSGTLTFEDFSAVLECLGDESSNDYKKQKFEEADSDTDGRISYDEYLNTIYNFNMQDESGELKGLAKLCQEVADNIKFVSSLSVAEQLEYGLF